MKRGGRHFIFHPSAFILCYFHENLDRVLFFGQQAIISA